MRGINVKQPQDVHGHGDRTLARRSAGLGRAALQQNHHQSYRLDLAIASPKYSQELLFGTQTRPPGWGEPFRNEEPGLAICLYNSEERIFLRTSQRYMWIPVSPFWELLQQVAIAGWNLVISIRVPCLSSGKGLTTQLCAWGLSNPISSCTAATIILSTA